MPSPKQIVIHFQKSVLTSREASSGDSVLGCGRPAKNRVLTTDIAKVECSHCKRCEEYRKLSGNQKEARPFENAMPW